MTSGKPRVIVITGPTASGKSALAVELAAYFGGEIVNADSMQVYRGMDVGTAKPTVSERRGIAHHLLDVVDPDEPFDAAKYRALAIPRIREIVSRDRVPFVVGGTGLYIKTLLGGLLKSPPAAPPLREELRRAWEEKGHAHLHERLRDLDPESARRIHPHDRVRVIRALEIIRLTGQPLSALARRHGFKERPFEPLKICLDLPRQELYERINRRSLQMMEGGLVEETAGLLARGYGPHLKPMKSLGYRHVVKYLQGEWGLERAVEEMQRDTRRYAKRQLTWFGADPEMIWARAEAREFILGQIEAFLTKTP